METRLLRSGAAQIANQEERPILGSLKKLIPGTSAFVNAKTLSAAKKEEKLAKRNAEKYPKLDDSNYMTSSVFPTFHKHKMSPADVEDLLVKLLVNSKKSA
ncbi:hypothetical protein L917_04528 [Phytophthora nicotianae]|uniref:Uncharacterized protein n=1 Tax=Phytophthora nicotianae TaxID=4792 RepID=W2LNT2_PHYNI|nr:hypothetical protein L917_04528 [Phytophthora nicotianae]